MRPKTVVGYVRENIHVVCPSHDGAERQNPLGYFTDGARRASFGRALQRDAHGAWARPGVDGDHVVGGQDDGRSGTRESYDTLDQSIELAEIAVAEVDDVLLPR